MSFTSADRSTTVHPATMRDIHLRMPGWLAGLCVSMCVVCAQAADAMQLDLRLPAYRQTIYATQTDQSIDIGVKLPAALQGRVSEIRGRLLDGEERELAVTRPGLQPTERLLFDGGALAVGQYTVAISACGANGVVLAEAKTTVHNVERSPGSEVRVDEHRNLIVDGHPSLQIGWYGEVRLDDPRPDVLRLQNLQTAIVVVYPDKSPVNRLFQEHGIRTMVNLEPGRLLYTFELWKNADHPVVGEHTRLSAPSAECREMLRKMIELMRDEPGLFGWYIADEPEINQFRADYLEAYYQAIRELDPYHPVIVTNDTLEGIDYAFSDIRLVQQPKDGLLVTMADGSPIPRVLKIGDRLLFQLFLSEPATDAVVELQRDSWYEPVRINGEPYVQLLKAGRDKDGRYWSAVVTLGDGTDTFHVEGYPVLFRATITGGALTETLSTLMVDIASPEANR